MIGKRTLAAVVLVSALAAGVAFAQTPTSFRDQALAADAKFQTTAALAALDKGLKQFPNDPGLLAAKGRIYWRLMRTKSAEQALLAATKSPAFAAEANYFLGRIYDFKGSKAEGAFPGFHEEVNYRPLAAAAFAKAGTPRPEWNDTTDRFEAALKEADAAITQLVSREGALGDDLNAAIARRIELRPDPFSYLAGANALLARKDNLWYAIRLATDGKIVGDRFIRENESSYKLDGKVAGFLDRTAAGFADVAGWAAFIQGDMKVAEERLAEAGRLSRNLDPVNQLHLGQLSRAKQDLSSAREHYLTVLDLSASTQVQRDAATTALRDVDAKSGGNPMEFDKWLASTVTFRRDARREALVHDMAGKKLPPLVLTDLKGQKIDLAAERGHVVMLNFFSSWCGACKVEMPLIQKAYEKYQDDPSVKFILVSIDDDPARLDRYVAERKFAMPVARYTREQATQKFNVHDTPTTLYVDATGTIRYQVVGLEPHGDAVDRVTWYIEQLKASVDKGK